MQRQPQNQSIYQSQNINIEYQLLYTNYNKLVNDTNDLYSKIQISQAQYNLLLQRYQQTQSLIQQMADNQKVYENEIQSLKMENQRLKLSSNNDQQQQNYPSF